MAKLVLTGGPSGGKTTVAQAIQKEFASTVTVVPEAASIVYGGGWPRRKTAEGVRHQQKAIYFLQRELEAMLTEENPNRLIVCDRGSLDGIAYWPGDGTEYIHAVGSTIAAEIKRYDWVIHLDTAPARYFDSSNPLRNENFEEAWRLNEKVKAAWAAHPRRFVIESHENVHFIEKMNRALSLIEGIAKGRSFEELTAMVRSTLQESPALTV